MVPVSPVLFALLRACGFRAASISSAAGPALALLGGATFAALPAAVQAPVLVPVLRETRRSAELDLFLPASMCVLELVRRARPSEASRFQQLFEQNWRGFNRLNTL